MSLIDKLTKEQISDFREAFSLFDHDENGSISHIELGQVLQALGQTPSQNELLDMINEVDVDGNGFVEFAEFVILMTNKVKEMTKEEEITEAFNVLDKEKDNHISVKELKYFMRKVAHIKLSSEEAEAMIEFADSDEDGLVSFDDFVQVVTLAQGGIDAHQEIEDDQADSDEESNTFRSDQ